MIRDIPKICGYPKLYDKAMSGKSRKASCKAMCLECVSWERVEVALCSDRGCPMFPWRPYKKVKKGDIICQQYPDDTGSGVESKKGRDKVK